MPSSLTLRSPCCDVCEREDNLLRCAGCQVVSYCGRDHQTLAWPAHKGRCSAVRKARIRTDREEQKLRAQQGGDAWTWPSPFVHGVGRFWGIVETRPYMRARFGLVDLMIQEFGLPGEHRAAVELALDHLLDMTRLCRTDNMGLRDMIPALYIRLGRDQEAYDFLKWHATTGQRGDYDWGNMDLPFLDVKNADALEPTKDLWSRRFAALGATSAVALIKLRILFDLQAIQIATVTLQYRMPQEIINIVRSELVGSIVEARPEILRADTIELARLIRTAATQVEQMYEYINDTNPHFWHQLLDNPDAATEPPPDAYTSGSADQACLMLRYSYSAWAETPRAIEYIRKLHRDF